MSGDVLVIDSGVGGLSICSSLLQLMPNLTIQYVADDSAFPYGTKDESFLISRLSALIAQCHEQFEFDLVILACNTISTLVLPVLREQFSIPIVGVVPAIKPAAAMSRTSAIGLLATPGTVSREYTDQLVRDHASHCWVQKVGSNALVEQAEKLLSGKGVSTDVLKREIQPFIDCAEDIDVIVLGCTHFPFLKSELAELMPKVRWVDSGEAIARRVKTLLREAGCDEGMRQQGTQHTILFTGETPQGAHFQEALKGLGFERVQIKLLIDAL